MGSFPGIHISFSTSAILAAIFVLAAFGAAYVLYLRTLPPVSRTRRAILTGLRAASLTLLLLLLLEPYLRFVSVRTESPTLAVLVDDSRSMRLTDRQGDRAAQLRRVVGSDALRAIARDAHVLVYSFGAALGRQIDPTADSLTLNAGATNISAALRGIDHLRDRQSVDAILLITDGSYNLGENPLYDAEKAAIPVFTVGIGDSSEQKDLLVSRVAANDLVYAGTRSPADVTIRSSGFAEERVEVTLSEGGHELDRSTLTLMPGTHEYDVPMTFVPTGEGVKKYSVRVSSLPGELTPSNNALTFYAKVLKSKLHITMFAGFPSPDLAVTRQTLVEDTNFTVSSFTERPGGGYYEGHPSESMIDSTDCLVLIDLPTSSTSRQTMDLLERALLRRDTPCLLVAGKEADYSRLAQLGSVFPFTVDRTFPGEQYVSMRVAPGQGENPVLVTGVSGGAESWSRLPPVFMARTTFRATPDAVILGYCRLGNTVLSEPLILMRSTGGRKSIAVLCYGIWRWRLMAQGNTGTAGLLQAFLSNCVRWLTTPEEKKPVRVAPSRDSYSQGEPVEFTAQVYNASAQPVDNARVTVTAQREGSALQANLRPIGNGRYEGSIEGLSEGEYTFRGEASADSVRLGEDRGRFRVGGMDLEFQDTRMNASLLRQIASATGGAYFTPDAVGGLPQALASTPSFASRKIERTSAVEVWHWQYMVLCLVVLLGAEWVIRRRSGML